MKKILAFVLALTLLVSLCACGKEAAKDDSNADATTTTTAATTESVVSTTTTAASTTLTTTEVGDDNSTPTGGEADSTDKYFSSVEMSRQRARDEALEVLNAVVENDKATDAVKEEAMKEMQTIAREMSQESNIESILMGKGFSQCIAVINGDTANIVVRHEGERLQSAQLAQINAVVYEQAGIEPINITIVAKN